MGEPRLVSVDSETLLFPPAVMAALADVFSNSGIIVSGRYYGADSHTLTLATIADGTCMAIPIWTSSAATFNRIAVEVTTAVAAANLRMGIYLNDPARDAPGALLAEAGTISAATVGVKELTISQSLEAGLHWLAVVAQGGAPNMRVLAGSLAPVTATAFWATTAAADPNCYTMTGVTGGLPGTWSTAALQVSPSGPKVMLRAA
ncbi:hypothetical protein [Leifsonia sp. WHRI 6310E]|uniref:hypothetical protein n=1 Tax=Leifsonia sp. WHRI 6310E TaxID=3162562 RepID=UPI0032ED5D65